MSGFSLGMTTARERLHGAAGLGAPAFAVLAVVGSAVIERHVEPSVAADVTLAGVAFGFCLPLVAYAIVAQSTQHGRLDDAVRHLCRHGANRRSAIAGLVARTALHVATVSAVLGVFAVGVARARFDTATLSDAFTSAWIGALGGAAYAAWFSLGSLLGRAGGGRLLALVLDFVVGAGSTAAACPWPRAHVRSLIGGELVAGMPVWGSAALLIVLAIAYLFLCLVRVAR